MKKNLFDAVKLLEENGFHVTRAYEENHGDAGNETGMLRHERTGAICLRIIPDKIEKPDGDQHSS